MAFSFFSLGIPTHPIPDKLYACSSLKQTYSLPGAFQGNEQFWLIAFYFLHNFHQVEISLVDLPGKKYKQ